MGAPGTGGVHLDGAPPRCVLQPAAVLRPRHHWRGRQGLIAVPGTPSSRAPRLAGRGAFTYARNSPGTEVALPAWTDDDRVTTRESSIIGLRSFVTGPHSTVLDPDVQRSHARPVRARPP